MEKHMNEKKIDFIICVDDGQYYDECMRYINDLIVPPEYMIDVISVQEADSMEEGYQEIMEQSEARYKVYLHQDVFILNQNFITDILKIFEDATVGMIGMRGSKTPELFSDGNTAWEYGSMAFFDGRHVEIKGIGNPSEENREVSLIDGCIIVTQYDLPWNTDMIGDWVLYSGVHSSRMTAAGYRIIVPYQSEPWCYHDKGAECRLASEENIQVFKRICPGIQIKNAEEGPKPDLVRSIKKDLIESIEQGGFCGLLSIADNLKEHWLPDNEVCAILHLIEIYELEERNIAHSHSQLYSLKAWEDIYVYYSELRHILLRISYNREDERKEILEEEYAEGCLSYDMLERLACITADNIDVIGECLPGKLEKEPLVSVIIPVYNGEGFVADTIQSVLSQSYQNIEVIIVDDMSTDKSMEVLSSFDDKRISIYQTGKNRNVCYSGNIGFQQAKGKYIALIGHDDIWHRDKLKRQIWFMETHPSYGVCFTWANIIDENCRIANEGSDEQKGLYHFFSCDNFSQYVRIQKLLDYGNCFCAPSACIRREIYGDSIRYKYGLLQLQDYELWLQLLRKAPCYILQERLVFYRRAGNQSHLGTITGSKYARLCNEAGYIIFSFIDSLNGEDFKAIFHNLMRNPKASSETELLCEKAFLLWDYKLVYAVKKFMELLEDDEARELLELQYDFTVQDFYKLNEQQLERSF